MSAIKSKFFLNNRSDKHKYRNEATRAAEFLQHIVDDFVDAIFEAPEKFKYQVIYLEFLDRWLDTCNHLKKVKPSFKVITIDSQFFADQFSPEVLAKKKFKSKFEITF